ncbi:MAG: flippase activity-associated protein Agl23 [Halobacteriaceae archaeon]
MSGSPRVDALRRRLAARGVPPTLALLCAVSAAALALRLWALGWRVAHQDEGRVGDWIVHYVEAGVWEYKPIIHGPFLPHVNGLLFPAVGANDFTARLVVALVGGTLPLAAWLFRTRLDDAEVVALGVVLSLNPVLVYYSRFMRNDVLLGAFVLVALGFGVRALDTRDGRYLHLAGLFLGLAFTTKENVLLYPVAWLGALALVLDHRLLLAAARSGAPGVGGGGPTRAADTPLSRRGHLAARLPTWTRRGAPAALGGLARAAGRRLREWHLHTPLALVEFALVVVLFYAPLPELWQVPTNPTTAPAVLEEATLGSWENFMGMWGSAGMRDHSYTEFASYYVGVLRTAATPLLALAVLGFGWARYADGDRPLIDFATYWGAASVVGYPVVMDIQAAWMATHVVVPLALPAAVGAGALARQFTRLAGEDRVDAALVALGAGGALVAASTLSERGLDAVLAGNATALVAAATVVLVALVALALARGGGTRRPRADQVVGGIAVAALALGAMQAGGLVYDTSFANPQSPDNPLVQYAQPSGKMQETLRQIYAFEAETTGPTVGYYGDESGRYDWQLIQPTETWSPPDNPPRGWFSRLPLPWYTSAHGVTTASYRNVSTLLADPPPVVIALERSGYGADGNTADDLEPLRERGYDRRVYQGYLWGRPLVFFVRQG